MPSTPTMVAGYDNLSLNDQNTTSAADGDGVSGFIYDGAVVYHLTRVLLLCGATCTGSSTRTSGTGAIANAAAGTDQWSSASKAAYQLCWWAGKITLGSVQFNFVFQLGGTAVYGVRIKMSIGAGNEFTHSGTGASATQVAAVSDEHIVAPLPASAGTDASPAYATLPNNVAAQYLSACWDGTTDYLAFEMHPAAGGTKSSAGFVFALLPFDTDSFKSTRGAHVVLCSPETLLAVENFTEASNNSRCIYECQRDIAAELAAVKAGYRLGAETTSADPAGDKIDDYVSWSRDTAPTDSGGLTSDCLVTGQVIAASIMHDVRVNPNSATVRRYLCLGNMALRVPNSFVSN